ncbi:MAG: class II aldolase/adducin family protein [Methanomassiliicoccales archaeon]|nr:MAG: class II aldolase/adducin family protein [Methanomassiliicoccales archaeon]
MRFMKERAEIVRFGKYLYDKGLVTGTSGNISVRGDEDTMLITPSGACKGMLSVSDMIEVRISDGELLSEGRPSMETPFHLAFYRKRRDVNAVVHSHPLYCTIFAVAGLRVFTTLTPESLLVLGREVPYVPYATPGSEDLAEGLTENMGDANAFLLDKHGAIAVGGSLKDAFHRLETLEFMAEMQYRLIAIEKGDPLPMDEVEKILRSGH